MENANADRHPHTHHACMDSGTHLQFYSDLTARLASELSWVLDTCINTHIKQERWSRSVEKRVKFLPLRDNGSWPLCACGSGSRVSFYVIYIVLYCYIRKTNRKIIALWFSPFPCIVIKGENPVFSSTDSPAFEGHCFPEALSRSQPGAALQWRGLSRRSLGASLVISLSPSLRAGGVKHPEGQEDSGHWDESTSLGRTCVFRVQWGKLLAFSWKLVFWFDPYWPDFSSVFCPLLWLEKLWAYKFREVSDSSMMHLLCAHRHRHLPGRRQGSRPGFQHLLTRLRRVLSQLCAGIRPCSANKEQLAHCPQSSSQC